MAAATLMPLLAQSFVDQASQTTFDMVRQSPSQRVSATDSPARSVRSPKRVTTSPRSRRPGLKESPRDKDGKPATDIFSWTDSILAERYQFLEEVGYGNWGSVWKVRPKQRGHEAVVQSVKLVHRSRSPTSSARVRALWTEFKCIRALRNAPHPNLIVFHSFIVSPSYGLIVMDYHPRLMPVALPESQAKGYFRQLLSAVEHLHTHGITHNDIKPSNILLSTKDFDRGIPILIDFGFARQYSLTAPDRFLSSLSWGTPEYLSPERAKGLVHDERLSDIFALGVTMYEIVVGRTPFEKTEEETFLDREQLSVYYERTTTGDFYGDYQISTGFDAFIHLLTEPSVPLRMQSCASALRHRFFDEPVTMSPARTTTNASSYATPDRPKVVLHASPTTSRAHDKTLRDSPQRMLKNRGEAFAIYQDPDASASSPAPSMQSSSSFSPRPLTLVNRVSPARTAPVLAPSSKTAPTQSVEQRAAIAKEARNAITSPTRSSRIPVRKMDVASGDRSAAAAKRFVSNPLASPTRQVGVRQRVLSQPLLSTLQSRGDAGTHGRGLGVAPPDRTASLRAIKRKPPPTLPELLDGTSDLTETSVKVTGGIIAEGDEPQERLLDQALVCLHAGPVGRGSASSAREVGETFTTRSYTIEIGKGEGRVSPILHANMPRLHKPSKTFASTASKISIKHVRRAPSTISYSAIKQAIGRRCRSSVHDLTFEMVEPEKDEDRNALTLPLNFETKVSSAAPPERARLASFSRHVQRVLDSRKSVDPMKTSAPLSCSSRSSEDTSATRPSAQFEPLQPTVQAPSSFTRNSSFSSTNGSSIQAGATVAPPQRTSSLRVRAISPADSDSSLASPFTSPSVSQDEFKPGHRRIPTAIRNVPSVVLHESADDADFSESDYSRTDTPAFNRVASPPPPPKVVEPSRQVPTWVPEEVSSDEGSDADVDEPTIKLPGSPSRLKRKPSSAASARTVRKGSTSSGVGSPGIISRGTSIARSRPSRNGTFEAALASAVIASGKITGPSPPASPLHAVLPFTNLHQFPDSRSTFETVGSSQSRSPSEPPSSEPVLKAKGLHKRSRSIMSFFSSSLSVHIGDRVTSVEGGDEAKIALGPVSHVSDTSNLAGSTTSRAELDTARVQAPNVLEEGERPKQVKKGGRLRKVMSRMFR